MDLLSQQIDLVLIEIFESFEQYQQLREPTFKKIKSVSKHTSELSAFCRSHSPTLLVFLFSQGIFNITAARRHLPISSLQYPVEFKAQKKLFDLSWISGNLRTVFWLPDRSKKKKKSIIDQEGGFSLISGHLLQQGNADIQEPLLRQRKPESIPVLEKEIQSSEKKSPSIGKEENPLTWFSFLIPSELRTAQNEMVLGKTGRHFFFFSDTGSFFLTRTISQLLVKLYRWHRSNSRSGFSRNTTISWSQRKPKCSLHQW